MQLKRVLRYLKGIENFVLRLDKELRPLVAYLDSDWTGDIGNRKATNGSLLQLAQTTICCKTRKQSYVALSSTEAEYIALSEIGKSVVCVV